MFTQAFIQAQVKETSKLRVADLCEGNSPVTGEFPPQRASNLENVFIWWRHHDYNLNVIMFYMCWLAGIGEPEFRPIRQTFTNSSAKPACDLWYEHVKISAEN